MPQVTVVLEEIEESILRPLSVDVINQVVTRCSLPKDIDVYFLGQMDQAKLQDTTIGNDPSVNDDIRKFRSMQKAIVRVEKEIMPEYVLSTGMQHDDQPACFADKELDIVMIPTRVPHIITFDFVLVFSDKFSAEKYRNNLLRTALLQRGAEAFKATFHYPITRSLLVILHYIHKCREAQGGYGEDISTWLKACFTKKITSITDQVGKNYVAAITETDYGLLGWYDFNDVPDKATYNKEDNNWEISFQFKIQLDMVMGYRMRYPNMVHNLLLPPALRPDDVPYFDDRYFHDSSLSKLVGDQLTAPFYDPFLCTQGMSIPYWDDWRPKEFTHGYGNILRLMTYIVPDNLRELVDMKTYGDDYTLDPFFYPYLEELGNKNFIENESPFFIAVHEGYKRLDGTQFEMSSDLIVSSSVDLSIRKNYHVTMDLCIDLLRLSPDAQKYLQNNAPLVLRMLEMYKINNYCVPVVYQDKFISDAEWQKMCLCLRHNIFHNVPPRAFFGTINLAIINAARKTEVTNDASA